MSEDDQHIDFEEQEESREPHLNAVHYTEADDSSLADELPSDVTFDMMAFGGVSTVCATAPIEGARASSYQSEAALEEAFIKQLQKQAYEYIHVKDEEALIYNLRHQLETLNKFEFSEEEWGQFFRQSIAGENEGIVEKTRRIQEDYVQPLRRDDGTIKNVQLIDKRNIHNNRLQVMNQYATEGGAHDSRYDVTILVNGLPLVHVELKRRGVAIQEAFNQIERYQRDSFWADSGLYEYVQIFVISNGTHTKYYSNTTRWSHTEEMSGRARKGGKKTSNSFKFTSWWAAADNQPIQDLVPFTKTFFAKHALLNILTKYCVFDVTEKLLVMRPYQITATEAILNRILISENDKSMLGTLRAGGYIWHSTGSGKTLTSFKTAKLATEIEGVDKVLFVVDRKDLDYQTMCEYDRFEKGAVDGSESTAVLTRQLEDRDKNGIEHEYPILVTTIQKLSCFIKKNSKHPVYDKHVVIIFDECHRSQFGDMHTAITKHFKNYHLFGFTGTPIFADNASSSGNVHLRTTEQAFGDRLHTYTIVDAIRDENVLPFRIDYIRTIRERDEYEDQKVYDIYRKGAYEATERVGLIVEYILDHFAQKTKRQAAYTIDEQRAMGFNSIFATASIDMAKIYYSAFKRIQEKRGGEQLKVALIYSFGVNESDDDSQLPEESFDVKSLDTPSRDFLDDAIADYNKMFATNFSTDGDGFQNYYKDLSDRLKSREVDIAIVVNMFLTGFDATTLNTLWVDKDLRDHGLIQAFSRTNRILNSVKTFGNIVCFRNLEDQVNHAISLFGDKDASGIILLKPYEEYLAEYRERLEQLFAEYPLGQDPVGEEAEKAFIRLFGTILRLRNILSSFDDFEDDDRLTARDEQDYRSIYQDLYMKYRADRQDATIINDDLVFEVELLKQVDINIDYILMLVKKYHESNCQDKVLIADIERAIKASYELRNKKDLIETFIDHLDASTDVDADWRAYVNQAKEEELSKIEEEENLDPEATQELVDRAFIDGDIKETGSEVLDIMRNKPSRFAPGGALEDAKERVIEKLRAYIKRFTGLGV